MFIIINKFKKNKKGFTYLELTASLCFGFLLAYIIAVFPIILLKDLKIFEIKTNYISSVNKISKAFYNDLTIGNKATVKSNKIIIGDNEYRLKKEALYRKNKDISNEMLLTDVPVSYKSEGNKIKIELKYNNDKITFNYNYNFSSFPSE